MEINGIANELSSKVTCLNTVNLAAFYVNLEAKVGISVAVAGANVAVVDARLAVVTLNLQSTHLGANKWPWKSPDRSRMGMVSW